MPQVEAVYSIPYADIKLYLINADGAPTGSPVWESACHNQVQVNERFTEKITFPTGARYGITHHVNEDHTVSISSLMDVVYGTHRNSRFVLYIEWKASDVPESAPARRWLNRTYYGVTYQSLDLGGQDASAMNQGLAFRSQFYRQSRGTGAPTSPG